MMQIVLPDLGENVEEATVSFWHIEEGDHVEAGDDVVEIITEKATFNIQAPCTGVVTEIMVHEGDIAQVGDALANIEEEE